MTIEVATQRLARNGFKCFARSTFLLNYESWNYDAAANL
jgi:hypothetical protein